MNVLTIRAFSLRREEPIASKLAVVDNPDGITLRALIDEKIKQAAPSFSFSAADHIARVIRTSDRTDVTDLLDFPVSLLLGELQSQPEIAVTIDNTVASSSGDDGAVNNYKSEGDVGSTSSSSSESLDALAQIVANALAERTVNPQEQEPFKFDPSSKMDLLRPVTISGTNTVMDNISVITPVTVAIYEPEVPAWEHERYQESPDIATLGDLVNDLTKAGNEEGAINEVTQVLMENNSLSISSGVALFCLTKLWTLARRSLENKRIIFDGRTLEAIIETMMVYRDMSADIQTTACGLLWTLSMEPEDRKHVAQSGGCDAILKAMEAHTDVGGLQVMALGALKVLSSSSQSKASMKLRRTASVVADVMQKHAYKPAVQTQGCYILGNLAVSDANRFVHAVAQEEISAVVNGILANPENLGVHEAACFTLMSLACSAANVELIRKNELSEVALQFAIEKNPARLANNILILLRRLKFNTHATGK
mmetsp:Transcript_42609/g.90611  ORF Transcript_42609/g.90611 Transcript_42609/m.90611 type:complete len:482 (+) Transcript_42609:121-1566(+)